MKRFLALATAAALIPAAGAQFVPGAGGLPPGGGTLTGTAVGAPGLGFGLGNGFVNPFGGYFDPFGGYLRGAADVLDAQGQYLINRQEALMKRERLRQEKFETRRKRIEQFLWERENLPKAEDYRQEALAEMLRRSVNNPPPEQVADGQAINSILESLASRPDLSAVTDVDIPSGTLNKVAVTSPGKQVNIGLLGKDGGVKFPLAFDALGDKGETLAVQIDTTMRTVFASVRDKGEADAADARKLRKAISEMDDVIRQKGRAKEISFAAQSNASQHMRKVKNALGLLESADAQSYINGTNAASGKTVSEFVRHMAGRGLRVAPAPAGSASAYSALHNALVRFYNSMTAKLASGK